MTARIRRLWQSSEPRQSFWEAREASRWVLVALTMATSASVGSSVLYEGRNIGEISGAVWALIAFGVIFCVAIWIRVSYALIVGFGILMLVPAIANPLLFSFAAPVIAALSAMYCSARLRVVSLCGLLLWSLWAASVFADSLPFALLAALAILTCILGYAVGASFRFIHSEHDQSKQQVQQMIAEREMAIAAERESLAQDLHDIVAHDITLIAMHSRAAQMEGTTEAYREAVVVAAESARDALADLRRLLKVLGRSSADLECPTPNDAPKDQDIESDMAALAARLRSLGFAVETHLNIDTQRLPPSLKLAIYRILQECVTNIIKHAQPGDQCWLSLEQDAAAVTVKVRNTLNNPVLETSLLGGTSRGLRGITTRAEAFGGHMSSGTCDDGCWEITISGMRVE